MKRALLLLLLGAGCSRPAEAPVATGRSTARSTSPSPSSSSSASPSPSSSTSLSPSPAAPAPLGKLHAFLGTTEGMSSDLVVFDLASPDQPKKVLTVAHSPGFLPRGAMRADGRAWGYVVMPEHARLGASAEVHAYLEDEGKERLLDDAALPLQEPRWVGDRFCWLRAEMLPPRFGPDGKQRQSLQTSTVFCQEPAVSTPAVPLFSDTGLWLQLAAVVHGRDGSPHLLALRIADEGSALLDIDPSTGRASRVELGTGRFRDVQVDPSGARAAFVLSVPEQSEAGALLSVELDTGRRRAIRETLPFHASPVVLPGGEVRVTEGSSGPDNRGTVRAPRLAIGPGAVLVQELLDLRQGGQRWVLSTAVGDRDLIGDRSLRSELSILGISP